MIKRVFKFWWGWNPSTIESYLEAMALVGWKLSDARIGFTYFTFVKQNPETIRYTFDYQTTIDLEYQTIIEDDHWTMVKHQGGWILWAKQYEGKRPELLSDFQSLIDRNNHLLKIVAISSMLQLPFIATVLLNSKINAMFKEYTTISVLYGMALLFLVFSTIRLLISNYFLIKKRP